MIRRDMKRTGPDSPGYPMLPASPPEGSYAKQGVEQPDRNHAAALERAARQPSATHAFDRVRPARCASARWRLARGLGVGSHRRAAGPGRTQPALSRSEPCWRSRAMAGAGGSALAALPARLEGSRYPPGSVARRAQRQRAGVPVGLRTGARKRPGRRGNGLAGTHRFRPPAASPTGCPGTGQAGFPVPTGTGAGSAVPGRPAPPARAGWRPRHPGRPAQMPGQPPATPGLDTILGLCEHDPPDCRS